MLTMVATNKSMRVVPDFRRSHTWRKRFGAVQKESLHLFWARVPGETPILGGPARVEVLDDEIVSDLVDRVGTDQAVALGIDAFDSDWLGTTKALYYVSPSVGSIRRWPWRDVRAVRVMRRRLNLATYVLEFESPQAPLEMITSRKSARRLITLHATCERYPRSPRPGSDAAPASRPSRGNST